MPFVIQGYTTTKFFDSFDIFGGDSLGMFYAPSQSIQRRMLIHFFQSIQERCYIFIVTNMHPEGDSLFCESGYVFFDGSAHRIRIDDDRRFVEILMIM